MSSQPPSLYASGSPRGSISPPDINLDRRKPGPPPPYRPPPIESPPKRNVDPPSLNRRNSQASVTSSTRDIYVERPSRLEVEPPDLGLPPPRPRRPDGEAEPPPLPRRPPHQGRELDNIGLPLPKPNQKPSLESMTSVPLSLSKSFGNLTMSSEGAESRLEGAHSADQLDQLNKVRSRRGTVVFSYIREGTGG